MICGYLETTIKIRKCTLCNCILGKYAKKTLQICSKCLDKTRSKKATIKSCATLYCPNIFKNKNDSNTYCQQCRDEIYRWDIENGNLWKTEAYKILENITHRTFLLHTLKEKYPQLHKQKLLNYLTKHRKSGTIIRIEPGLYIQAE